MKRKGYYAVYDAHVSKIRKVREDLTQYNQHGCADNHLRALKEVPVAMMIRALGDYADRHFSAHDSPVGTDYFVGEGWMDMCAIILRCFGSTELYGLDSVWMNSLLLDMMRNEGFTEDEINMLSKRRAA